jgi:hypothetical protein
VSDADDIIRQFKNAILVRNVIARISGHEVIPMEKPSEKALAKLAETVRQAGDTGKK